MSLVLCEKRRSALVAKEPRDPIAFFGQRPMLPRGTLGDDHVLAAHDHGVRGRAARDVLAVPTPRPPRACFRATAAFNTESAPCGAAATAAIWCPMRSNRSINWESFLGRQ